MYRSFFVGILAFSSLFLSAQSLQPLAPADYTELTDTKPIDHAAWEAVSASGGASWGTVDVRYSKWNFPSEKPVKKLSLSAWKGERVNAQAYYWTKEPVQKLSATISDLKGKGGASIPASAITTSMVRYVMTDELNKDGRGACGNRADKSAWDSSMVADVLDVIPFRDVAARSVQPVWVNIWVPAGTPSGSYSGKLTLAAEGGILMELPLQIDVLNQTLPAPSDWAFHLDLWQNPFSVARYHQLPLWSEAHFEAMRPTMKLLADAGQKVITTTIMHKPWGGQTYDYFGSMVTRTKKIDGSWSFDYAIFDKWVEFMMSVGITKQINCYSLIPWKLTFQYFDQATDSMMSFDTEPGTPAYENFWFDFLVDFAAHLRAKGWWEIATIGMDERPMEAMQKAIALIKRADPGYKVSLAGNYHKEIEADLYDYCIAHGRSFPAEVKAKREKLGQFSTFYTCCAEPYPNTFTFSPPAESAILGW
ncbi:MAG: glycoside hydrolase domain-containing protein, partial [Bacteroidales bacterium]